MTKVKICGLKRECDIEFANSLLPDFIGFVFAEASKRYIHPDKAAELKEKLDNRIKAVGVFVNASLEFVAQVASKGIIDMIQLHGSETNACINELRELLNIPIIKAFKVASKNDIALAMESVADIVLLDNGNGGTGETFDWSYISGIKRPFVLAGGLTFENITEALRKYKPYAVDTSSGVETDGVKDFEKIKRFINIARNI